MKELHLDEIEEKEDSLAKLAAVKKIPKKYVIFANEFNVIVKALKKCISNKADLVEGKVPIAQLPSNGSIEIKGEYYSNSVALLGGLNPGDIYHLPLYEDSESNIHDVALLAVVKKIPEAILTLTWANIDTDISNFGISDKNSLSQWTSFLSSKINSAPLTSLEVRGNTIVFKFKVSTAIGSVDLANMLLTDFKLENFNNLSYLGLSDNHLTYFNPTIALPDNLKQLSLSRNLLTEFNPTLGLPNGLVTLEISFNHLTDFNPTEPLPYYLSTIWLDGNGLTSFGVINSLPHSLRFLQLANNQLTKFNPAQSLPSFLNDLGLMGNQLTEFNPTLPLPESLVSLSLGGNKLTSFNPKLPLPRALKELDIGGNLISTSSWNDNTEWIGLAPDNGKLNAIYGLNTVIGTNTETLLLAKNWTVRKT